MMDTTPAWSLKRAAGGEASQGGSAARARTEVVTRARGIAESTEGGDTLVELVKILTMLSLTNSADLRTMIGIVATTYIYEGDTRTVNAAKGAGSSYDVTAKALNERRKRGEEVEEMCAPYIYV